METSLTHSLLSVPPNVRFIIDDFDDTWVEKDLDFIHGRYLAGSSKDFAKLLRECYKYLSTSP